MWARIRCWRGVSPVASAGPSGSSVTVFFAIARFSRVGWLVWGGPTAGDTST